MNQAEHAIQTRPFQFTGTGGEYFRIWIVNLILGILTLGIYSAWAKVRTNRYFYGNTQVDETGFEYHAKPMAILKGRLLAVALLLIYVFAGQMFPAAGLVFALLLLLASPWIIWKGMQFNARMSSFRNVRFGFRGSLLDAYRYLLFIPLIPALTAVLYGIVMYFVTGNTDPGAYASLVTITVLVTYLMIPLLQKLVTGYYIGNHCYGQGRLHAALTAKKYYLTYLGMLGWSVLIVVAIGLAAAASVYFSGIDFAAMVPAAEGGAPPAMTAAMGPLIATGVLVYVALLLAGVWIKAYMKTKIRNYVLGHTRLDDIVQLESGVRTGQLFRCYLVNILLMIGTLGLAYPWVKVRLARIMAQTTAAHVSGSLDQYVSLQQSRQSAIGDEIGEAFDVDASLDLAF